MKQPWQIWAIFLLCLAIMFPAMGWLSWKTMELDSLRETDRAQTEIARQEAELQERISTALYRMDLALLPLVTHEAARPHYFYQSFYTVTNPTVTTPNVAANAPAFPESGLSETQQVERSSVTDQTSVSQVPSPLLLSPPEFVLLHFEVGPNENIASPQSPSEESACQLAVGCGVAKTQIEEHAQKLDQALKLFRYDSLVSQCEPPESVQVVKNNSAQSALASVYDVPAISRFLKEGKGNLGDNGYGKPIGKKTERPQGKIAMQQSRGNDRSNEEFNRRLDTTMNFAGQQMAARNALDNQTPFNPQLRQALTDPESPIVREGVMQPIWVGERLILARRVDGKETPVVQCCWLDWNAIRKRLKDEVADLLPDVEFEPVTEETQINLRTALTTLPVQLVVDSQSLLSTLALDSSSLQGGTSGLRMSLLVAWLGLGLAAIASAFLLHGVMRLSERRATFVSAVTHELRTPLTTFRMYAEMLAEKMVPEDKQQEYANTLRVQADRLSHLVENVLQYAKLERGSDQNNFEKVSINDLLDRFTKRLSERASEAEMDLKISVEDPADGLVIETQPANVEQVLFNLVDNACKYAKPSRDNRIELTCCKRDNSIQFRVRDFGPGVAPKFRKRLFQPFCKSDQDAANSAPGVGLGLALCRRMAKSLGGRLFIDECNQGAVFVLEIPRQATT